MSLNSALSAIPTLLVIWASLVACFVGLLTYRGQLSRYEETELFLSEHDPDAEREQSDIDRRVNKMQPLVQFFGGAAGLVTVGIVSIWVADAIRILQETHSL